MPASRKIVDLEKLRSSLATICTHCGYRIPPAEIQRPASGQIKCPRCGSVSESNAQAAKPPEFRRSAGSPQRHRGFVGVDGRIAGTRTALTEIQKQSEINGKIAVPLVSSHY